MTADYVFEHVMHMHDDGDESTGEYNTNDNREYRNRMLPMINQRLSELAAYSTPMATASSGNRVPVTRITSWDQEIELDDLCLDALCFGVAALMFTVEDTMSANYYQQEYERLLGDIKSGKGILAVSEDIVDVYGGGYYDGNGEWHYNSGNGIGFEWVGVW